MSQTFPAPPGRQRAWPRLGLCGLLAVLALAQPAASPTALASPQQEEVTVRVTIERVRAQDCLDDTLWWCDEADFYAVVNIPDQEARTPSIESDDIRPDWEISARVALSLVRVPLTIGIWDADGGVRGDDDHADIKDGPGRNLNLTVDLAPCAVGGDLTGACNVQLTSSGDDGGDDEAQVWFRIEVERPASATDLRLRCLHDPLWPQPGQAVTFTVDALDSALAPRTAEAIEVWLGGGAAAAHTCNVAGTCSHTAGPFAGTLDYACLVRDGGREVWSGWRSVTVGMTGVGAAVPVLFTGPRRSRIDVVLVADRDNYSGGTDPAFLTAARDVIRGSFFAEELYLANQDELNFWLAQGTGDAEGFSGGSCSRTGRLGQRLQLRRRGRRAARRQLA